MRQLAIVVCLCVSASATLHYVDPNATGSGNGSSWANAWTSFASITGLAAGDTVYISGGSTSQAYSLSSWTPASGTSGNSITYSTGQDAGHNGVVTITSTNWLSGDFHDVTITGNVGGSQNWQVTPSNYIWEGSSGSVTNVILSYINVPQMGAGFHLANDSVNSLEISHCNIVKTNDSSNIHDFIFFGVAGQSAHAVLVHDSFIEFPYSSSDHSIGDDMWIWPNNLDFYNNTVQGHPGTYTWNQHSDVFQASQEKNVHVYNNTIIDPGESVYYEDSQGAGTVSSLLIYNNLIMRTISCNGGAQRIFDMNPENAGANATPYVDVVIANNDIIDQSSPCIFWARFLAVGSFTRTYLENNLVYPTNTGTSIQSGVTVSNNYASNGTSFVSYTLHGGQSNNLNLQSGDTTAKGQGSSTMSTYFTTDFVGNTRTVPWDIGAYKFVSSSQASPPTCNPGSGNYTSSQTVTCTNPNAGTTVQCYRVGSTPATNGSGTACAAGSTLITSPSGTVSVSTSTVGETLNVIAGTSVLTDSIVNSYVYTFNLPTPSFIPPAGSYTSPQTVAISSQTGATICYAIGSNPSATVAGTCDAGSTSLANGGTISVPTGNTTVNALATESSFANSSLGSAVYSIGNVVHVSGGCSAAAAGTSGSNSWTFSCTPSATNDAIVLFVSCHPTSGTITAIGLTASGWAISSLAGPVATGAGTYVGLFGTIAPNTSATTFTATFTGVSNCSTSAVHLSEEFSGNNTTGGATTFNSVGSAGGSSGNCNQSAANVTPTNNNNAVWFGCLDNVGSVPNPWLPGVNDSAGDVGEYQILDGGSGVAVTPSFNSSITGPYVVAGTTIAPNTNVYFPTHTTTGNVTMTGNVVQQ